MFDNLVESEPQGSDLKDRRKYFAVSSIVVGILFTTAVVVSIFAADYGLGNGRLDLVEMIAPVAPDPVEPEIRETRAPADSSPSTSQSSLPSRQINMSRTDEPTIVPTNVSTTQNPYAARPDGRFDFKMVDSGPGGSPNGSGRDPGASGPGGSGLEETLGKNNQQIEPEETAPPPVVKKAPPAKTTVSKGVLNGTAKELPKPLYSAAARLVGAQGQVSVQVTINESGRVIAANAVSGHILLRPEAEKAARNARFSPTLLSDVPVKVTGVITYNFVK